MRTFYKIFFGVLVLTTSVALIVASPQAMVWISKIWEDWELLNQVGQSYGFAAALLSGLSLILVSVALIYQAREMRLSRTLGVRATHIELFRLAYEYPELQEAWAKESNPIQGSWMLRTYTNLVFGYFQMMYTTGEIRDRNLRRIASNRFQTENGREFWRRARNSYAVKGSRKSKKFFKIVDEEYMKSLDGDSKFGQEKHTYRAGVVSAASRHWLLSATLGATAGIALVYIISRKANKVWKF